MKTQTLACCLALLALAAVAVGCSGNPRDASSAAAATNAGEASTDTQVPPSRTLPIPGHPGSEPSAAQGHGVIQWSTPEGWIEEQPSSSMRMAQYRVEGPDGDGLCVVYYFGPGQGGDPMANANRWAGQFEQPDGRSSLEVMQVSELEGARIPTRIVEVTGTYDGGMTMTAAPGAKSAGYMLLGGIAEGADAPWFFKFTGPESTVRAQKASFVGMMESLRFED
jgi:hypothetical protein